MTRCDHATCDAEAEMVYALDGERRVYCSDHASHVEGDYPGEIVVLGPLEGTQD